MWRATFRLALTGTTSSALSRAILISCSPQPGKELGRGNERRCRAPKPRRSYAVCAGKVGFECTIVRLRGDTQALLQRFVAPGPLDLLSVEFAAGEDADGFVPPAWFGPEVTQNPAYHRGSLARTGLPASEDIPLSNAMLEELLDVIEEGTIAAQLGRGASPNVRDDRSAQGPSEGAFSAEGSCAFGRKRAGRWTDGGPCRGAQGRPADEVGSRC